MTAIAYVGQWREINMKLQMVNVTRKFGDFRAVENLNLTIEWSIWTFRCEWCRKDNAYANDLYPFDTDKWTDSV